MGTSLNGLTPAGTYPGLIKTGDNAPIDGTLKTLSDGNGNNLPMAVSTTAVNFTNQLQQSGVAVPTASQVNAKQDTLVSGTNIKTINGTSVLGSGDIVTPYTPPSGVSGAIQFSNGSAFASDASNLFWDDANNRLGVGTNAPSATAHFKGVDQLSTSTSLLVQDSIGTNILRVHNQANNSAVVMSTAKIADYEIISGNVLFNTSMRFVPTTGGLAINKDYSSASSNTLVHLKGSGSTSATTSLLVQNSDGTNWLQVKDDGDITNGANGSNELKFEISPVANKFFRLTRQSTNVDFYSGSGGNASIETSGGQPFSLIASSAYLTLSNGGVSIGATLNTTNASAILDVTSTTKGFLPPRMTTTQRDAIATPATGLKVYNTTTNTTDTYDGTTWQRFGQQTFIKGSGSTSATTSLLVQNSAGTAALTLKDDLSVLISAGGIFGFGDTTNYAKKSGAIDGVEIAGYGGVGLGAFGGINTFVVHSGSASLGATTANASAIFDITSTTKGFLPPRMTTTQKNAIASPASGLVVYDSTTNKLCCYNGSTWNDLF